MKSGNKWTDVSFNKNMKFWHDILPEGNTLPRNVSMGMSTNGLNPFGNQSSTHSTWPVLVWPYNLPLWLCSKQRYVHMSILIQGPKQPVVDMHLYLGLLKEELATLWETPRRTWEHTKEIISL